jgi:hypothetical protein
MPFGATPKDNGGTGTPISCVYVQGYGFVPLMGTPQAGVDANGNLSTTAVMTIGGAPATDPYLATVFAGGELRVRQRPLQIFLDTFDSATLDIINRWKTPTSGNGGVAASNTATFTALGTGTTANGYSVLESVPTFTPSTPGWLYVQMPVNVEFPVLVNSYRFWGLGTSPTTPTALLPLTNACGFELAITGKLYAVTYQSGNRVMVADLSSGTGTNKQPLDSNPHNYIVEFRGDRIFWMIDGDDAVVASTPNGAQGPDVNALPLHFVSIASSTPPVSNCNLQINAAIVGDSARREMQLSDGMFPWRKATVDALGNMSVAPGYYNGATVDAARGNINTGALITAVGATVTQTGADQTNYNGRGVVVTLNMTVVGTGSVTLSIQGKDSISGQYYTLLAGLAVTTNVTNIYTVYPGIAASANVNASNVLPRTWRVVSTAGNANAATYTVAACVIL